MKYIPTIGLEIHAELKTQTKMFCDSPNDPDEKEPNMNVCPICMGHPGTLPTINKEAVRYVLKVGLALGGTLADFTEFDRKNYFYPDIPKGYQISQYKYPLVSSGELQGVAITRIHLEEDTARNIHTEDDSLIDFNRAGIPLMELVTEPVIHSAEEAGTFARELQLLLRYLDVSDADMEKGHMRVEANVSVAPEGERGTKVEIKNLNSFRAVERGIAYEVERQTAVLEEGGEVVHETRGWNENTGETFSQRAKELSHDYRYFPEPDLPKLKLSKMPEFAEATLREELPELPWERRERYSVMGLKKEDAGMFVQNKALGTYFETVSEKLPDEEKLRVANYLATDLAGLMSADASSRELPMVETFVTLMQMIAANELSSRGAKDILKIMYEEGGDPREIAEREGLLQKSDEGELKKVAQEIIAEHEDVAEEYKGGKETSLQFLVGQGMKKTGGAANPQVLQKLFKELLQ